MKISFLNDEKNYKVKTKNLPQFYSKELENVAYNCNPCIRRPVSTSVRTFFAILGRNLSKTEFTLQFVINLNIFSPSVVKSFSTEFHRKLRSASQRKLSRSSTGRQHPNTIIFPKEHRLYE